MNPKLKKHLGLDRPKRTFVIILVLIGLHFIFPSYVIASDSMEPALPVGSFVLALRSSFFLGEIKSDDVIVFDPVEGISNYPWAHRVMATQGDRFKPLKRRGRKDTSEQIEYISSGEGMIIPDGYLYQSGDGERSYHGLASMELVRSKVLFSFKLPWK